MTEQNVVKLNIVDIMNTIPHRFPFLLVDRVEILEEGKKAIGYKNITMNEDCFNGHFPGSPIFPGVLTVEAMAQPASSSAQQNWNSNFTVMRGTVAVPPAPEKSF